MKAGSSDSMMTLMGSCLLTLLLFLARYVLDQRAPTLPGPGAATQWNQPQGQASGGIAPPGGPVTPKGTSQTTAGNGHGATVVSATSNSEDASQPGTYKVVRVLDGDTADVLVNQQPVRLRFNGIDTPEKGQPFGNTAKEALAGLIGGRHIRYAVRDTDRYGRNIADLFVDDVYVNKWMVEQGLAWHYTAYSNDSDLAAAELDARNAKRGLWSDPRRVPPWNWRKLSKVERDAYR